MNFLNQSNQFPAPKKEFIMANHFTAYTQVKCNFRVNSWGIHNTSKNISKWKRKGSTYTLGFNNLVLHNFLSLLFGKPWLQPLAHSHFSLLTYQSRGKGEKQAAAGGNTGHLSLSLSLFLDMVLKVRWMKSVILYPLWQTLSLTNCSTWVNEYIKAFNWKEKVLWRLIFWLNTDYKGIFTMSACDKWLKTALFLQM